VTDDILDHAFIAVEQIPDSVDLVAAVRKLNSEELAVPWMWCLDVGGMELTDPNGHSLGVGVRGEIGALHWATNTGPSLVPAGGRNEEHVMYRMGGLHESYMPPHTEIPVDKVYEALSEFLTTRQLPTCIEWVPATSR
jgi:Immunity protein Imm1